MAATGKTPILLYGSTTATNTPVAGNLTNSSDGCEIAINVADKNLFFKDSTNTVNTVPIRQSSASSNGWLSSTDWSTFNGKSPAFTYTTGYIPFGQGTTTPNQNSSLFWDNTNKRLGLGTTNPSYQLHVYNSGGNGQIGLNYGSANNGLVEAFSAGLNVAALGATSYLTFASGGTSTSERVRIFASGGVSIGNTTDPGAANLYVTGKGRFGATDQGTTVSSGNDLGIGSTYFGLNPIGNNVDGVYFTATGGFNIRSASGQSGFGLSGTSGTHFTFYTYNAGLVGAGNINSNGSTTTYTTSSDYRLKTDIRKIENSGNFIDALNPVTFTWITDKRPDAGFLAHEFQQVSPNSVMGEKDTVDENGKPVYQSMQASSSEVIANIVAELQSLRDRVKQLEK